jgi:hypothetical protein
VLFLKERTPNTINQGRQGPNYKISGPIRNDIERWKDRHAKTKLPRASLTKPPTLRRGSRIQRSPMRASTVARAVLPVHGSTVDRPFKTKGYAIRVGSLDARVRDAAASMPKCVGARWELTGVAPGRRFRPLTRPHDSRKRRRDACARDRGVKGGDCASPAADARRGRCGRSGELVSAPKCARRRETGRG